MCYRGLIAGLKAVLGEDLISHEQPEKVQFFVPMASHDLKQVASVGWEFVNKMKE